MISFIPEGCSIESRTVFSDCVSFITFDLEQLFGVFYLLTFQDFDPLEGYKQLFCTTCPPLGLFGVSS